MLTATQFVATLCSALFTGAAIYINLVEHPARMSCDTKIAATDGWDETKDSDVVVCTAGAPRKPGMSREELLNGNADIVRAKVKDGVVAWRRLPVARRSRAHRVGGSLHAHRRQADE